MYVRALSDITRDDTAIAGGKGANLGELIGGGFPVPGGFVVTTSAYAAYVERCGIGARLAAATKDARAAQALFCGEVPGGIADEIVSAYAQLGDDVAVAVRSSATAEDLADASFAGQQDTYLNIHGPDAVLDAVRRCWASLWTQRAIAYRAQAKVDDEGLALAVVVQRLVPAEAAGVMFTANPTSGRRDEVVIDAAFGLGEAVVGGAVTPDAIVVRGDLLRSQVIADKRVLTTLTSTGTREEAVPESLRRSAVLTDDQALELTRLGRAVAGHLGAPQDIEWALSREGFAIVQSRPITALPEPDGPVPDTWPVPDAGGMYFRASIIEQLPDPLTPLFADLIRPAVTTSLASVLTRHFGAGFLRPGDLSFLTINGYAYYYYSRGGMLRMLALSPLAIPKILRGGQQGGLAYWRDVAHPAYLDLVTAESTREVGTMSAVELLEATRRLVDAGALYYTAVQAVIPLAAGSESIFTALYDRLARRPGDPSAVTFVLGGDSEPLRADASLYDLAQWCRATPGVAGVLLAEQACDRCERAGVRDAPREASALLRPQRLQPRSCLSGARRRPGARPGRAALLPPRRRTRPAGASTAIAHSATEGAAGAVRPTRPGACGAAQANPARGPAHRALARGRPGRRRPRLAGCTTLRARAGFTPGRQRCDQRARRRVLAHVSRTR